MRCTPKLSPLSVSSSPLLKASSTASRSHASVAPCTIGTRHALARCSIALTASTKTITFPPFAVQRRASCMRRRQEWGLPGGRARKYNRVSAGAPAGKVGGWCGTVRACSTSL
eukprot:4175510-Prymnesium_polylepis.1